MPSSKSNSLATAWTSSRTALSPRAKGGSGPGMPSERSWGELASSANLAAQYIGGEYTNRYHRGDEGAKPPLRPIEAAKQREAMKLLKNEILAEDAFQFSPDLLRHLAPDQWFDNPALMYFGSYQLPIYDQVLAIQRIVPSSRFLNPKVMRTIQDVELLAEPKQKVLKLPRSVRHAHRHHLERAAPEMPRRRKARSRRSRSRRSGAISSASIFSGSRRSCSGPSRAHGASPPSSSSSRRSRRRPTPAASPRKHLGQLHHTASTWCWATTRPKWTATPRAHLEEMRDRIAQGPQRVPPDRRAVTGPRGRPSSACPLTQANRTAPSAEIRLLLLAVVVLDLAFRPRGGSSGFGHLGR